MNKSRSLAFLLSAMMVATPFSAFAAEGENDAPQADPAQEVVQNDETPAEAATADAESATEAVAEAPATQEAPVKAPAAAEGEAADENETQDEVSDAWAAEDFTYGEMVIGTNENISPATATNDYVEETVWAITGFSESGTAKFENNKDVVIPAKDPDGKVIHGIAKDAFNKKGLTSVTFPEEVPYASNDKNWTTADGDTPDERGDYFIGYAAFRYNNLTEVTLPEGTLWTGTYAFANNSSLKTVNFPTSIKLIAMGAFYTCGLEELNFPEETDFPLCVDKMAFANNKLTEAWLPNDTEKITKQSFLMNTGMEAITVGTAAEKKGGLVYIYIDHTDGAYINSTTTGTSNTEKVLIGDAIPADVAHWSLRHFTVDGTTITGLSDEGKAKIVKDQNLVLPEQNAEGEDITAIGPGSAMGTGTFAYTDEEGNYYSPKTVEFPSTLEVIGKWAFSEMPVSATHPTQTGLTEVDFPDSLTTIEQQAFTNNCFTEVTIPDNLETIGIGVFAGNAATDINTSHIEEVTWPEHPKFTTIANGMFTAQNIKNIVIPEGITKVDSSAFNGNKAESVTIASTVTEIGSRAFSNNRFEEVEIPESVKTIGTYAFNYTSTEAGAAALTKVTLHEGLVSIGSNAFAGEAISEVALPTTVTTLHKDAFKGNGSESVKVYSTVKDQATAAGTYTKVVTTGSGHTVVYLPEVTFNAGEGTSEIPAVHTDKAGKLAALPIPIRAGYAFKGWFTAAEGGDAVTANTTYAEDTIIYAQWQKLYTITFDANGGSVDPATATTNADGKLESIPTPTREGYTFMGWENTTKGCGDAVDSSYVFDADSIVSAIWSKNAPDVIQVTPSVKLSATSYTYSGSVKTPAVTVSVDGAELTADDYTVAYAAGRKNVGTYNVTVTLKGKYEGSKTVSFKINPKKTSIKKLTGAKKSFKAVWAKQTKQVTGYKLQYSTSKKFSKAKTKTVKSYKTYKTTVKKLKKGKKYYVRIRTYKKVGTKTYYSAWSKTKAVRAK